MLGTTTVFILIRLNQRDMYFTKRDYNIAS